MATYQTRVEDLIGTVGDTQLITNSLTDAAAEIITQLPKECLWVASVNSGDVTAVNYNVEKCLVLNVIRENGTDGQYEDCKEVSPSYFRRVQDVNSMWYPSSSEPVYLVKNGHVFVYPAPGVSPNAFQVEYVSNPAVAFGDSAIGSFPDEYEHLVVLGGSVRCLQRLMNDNNVSLSVSVPSAPSLAPVSYSSQSLTLTDLTVTAVPPDVPTAPAFSSPGVASSSISFGTTAPVYTAPTSAISLVAFSSYTSGLTETDPGVLTVSSLSPSVPAAPAISSAGVASSTISFTTPVPLYVSPSVDISLVEFQNYTSGLTETDPGVISISAVAPSPPANPTISYSSASVGDGVSSAQDSIISAQDAVSGAVDSITGAVDGYTGETDTAMTGSASGVDESAGPTDAAGVTDTFAPTNADGTASTGSGSSAYTKPAITDSAGSTGSLTALLSLGVIGDDTDQLQFDTWWEILSDYIEDDEDIELAQAQMQKIRTYIDAFQAEVQNASAAMQATIETSRQATQASIANAGNDVSTNNASIASLTQASIANAGNDVSTNNASMSSLTQASIANASNDVSTNNASIASLTQASVANASNDVNASIAKMRESTGAATAKMQQSTSAATAKMQQSTSAATSKMQLSTQASIEKMRQSTSVNVQNAAQTLEATMQDYRMTLNRFSEEVKEYSAEVAKELQEQTLKFQQHTRMYDQLQSDYERGLKVIVGRFSQYQQPQRAES